MTKQILLSVIVFFSFNAFAVPVNVNTADAKTIADSLNGIGLKKAEAIVDYRLKNGDFKTIDDLTKVSGIGAKTIEKNKTDILLDEPQVVNEASKSVKQQSDASETQKENNVKSDKKLK